MPNIVQSAKIISFFVDFINENCSREVSQKIETDEFHNELMKIVTGSKNDSEFTERSEDMVHHASIADSCVEEKTNKLFLEICSTREEIFLKTEEKLSQQRTDLEHQMLERFTKLEQQLTDKSEEVKITLKELKEHQDKNSEEFRDEINDVKIKHRCHWHVPFRNLVGPKFPAREKLLRVDKDNKVFSHLGHYLGYTNNVYGKYYAENKYTRDKSKKGFTNTHLYGKDAKDLLTYTTKLCIRTDGFARRSEDDMPVEHYSFDNLPYQGCHARDDIPFAYNGTGKHVEYVPYCPAPIVEIQFSPLMKNLSADERLVYVEYGILPPKYEHLATSPGGEWADMKASIIEMNEHTFVDNLSVGDWVWYKRTNEYVEVIEIHKEDPDETLYTLLLPDGKERQTNTSNITEHPCKSSRRDGPDMSPPKYA